MITQLLGWFFFSDDVSKISACLAPEACGDINIALEDKMYQELYFAANTKFLSLSDTKADSEGFVTFN